MAKFYSLDYDMVIEAKVLEIRKYTVKLMLDDGKVIIKKHKQLIGG